MLTYRKSINVIVFFFIAISFLLPSAKTAYAMFPQLIVVPEDTGIYRVIVEITDGYQIKRLEDLNIQIIDANANPITIVVSEEQLEQLSKLHFLVFSIDEIGALINAHKDSYPEFSLSMKTSLSTISSNLKLVETPLTTDDYQIIEMQMEDFRLLSIDTLSNSQLETITILSSNDDDADGLTNTQEEWWCTNPLDPDSDNDGKSDGDEINRIHAWLHNDSANPPFDTPWADWPFGETCPDKDHDSIPNLAERWDLGLNMDLESSDFDKFDDGQEVFGVTYCPGGDNNCSYGDLPRSEDSGYVGSTLPGWIEAPGNHPFVAAFPIPEISIVDNSLTMETVTTITSSEIITEGTQNTYSTETVNGTSTSEENTETWNEWQELSESNQTITLNKFNIKSEPNTIFNLPSRVIASFKNYEEGNIDSCKDTANYIGDEALNLESVKIGKDLINLGDVSIGDTLIKYPAKAIGCIVGYNVARSKNFGEFIDGIKNPDSMQSPVYNETDTETIEQENNIVKDDETEKSTEGTTYYINNNELVARQLLQLQYILSAPKHTETIGEGSSNGGAISTKTENYEEFNTINSESFLNQESWETATAIDTNHSANFWFTYNVMNNGTEYAREIRNVTFNIYLGDSANPIYTYQVSNDSNNDLDFENFMPGETHTYTSQPIPLTFEQMKKIDLGESIRVTLEDFSYGVDELFYENIINNNIRIVIEDGIDDGDQTMDSYYIAINNESKVLDAIGSYFPYETNAEGMLVSYWTPEKTSTIPSWCTEGYTIGDTTWCKHYLSATDWWNIYFSGFEDGNSTLGELSAIRGSTLLFRVNKDSDADGYSDKAEIKFGTDYIDPAVFPKAELIAGLYSERSGNNVTATLSFLNTGLDDAVGVEAVIIAPDDTVTITNNTIGGSGRVNAGEHVVVSSRIFPPQTTDNSWSGSALPFSGGFYAGVAETTYGFSVTCINSTGCLLGTDEFSVSWSDGFGNSGLIGFDNTYQSPTLITIGDLGLKIGFYSGNVKNGERFSIRTVPPNDTFKYTINQEPYTPPQIMVVYSDGRGSHRFMLSEEAMQLNIPNENLLPLAQTALGETSLMVSTNTEFLPGLNTIHAFVYNPTQISIGNSQFVLNVYDQNGGRVLEEIHTETITPGPNTVALPFNTNNFSTYNEEEEYIVIIYWLDRQNIIIDINGRPSSSFGDDPQPIVSLSTTSIDNGQINNGNLIEKQIVVANTGDFPLIFEAFTNSNAIEVSQTEKAIGSSGTSKFAIIIDPNQLNEGAFEEIVTIKTNSIVDPTIDIQITGVIQSITSVTSLKKNALLPLEEYVFFPTEQEAFNQISYLSITSQNDRLKPIFVRDNSGIITGVGKDFEKLTSETDNPIFTIAVDQNKSFDSIETTRDGKLLPDLTQATIIDQTETFTYYQYQDGSGLILVEPKPINELIGLKTISESGYSNADGYWAKDTDYSSVHQTHTYIGRNISYGKGWTRSYIKYSLPSLPSCSQVTSANMYLYQYYWQGTSAFTVDLYRVTQNWNNDSSVWSGRDWGDWPSYDMALRSSASIGKSSGWKSWLITSMAQEWYSGIPNYGVMLKGRNEDDLGGVFYAVENSTNRPYVTISYEPIAPTSPIIVTISNSDANGNYRVDWNDVSCTANYQIEERHNGGSWVSLGTYTTSYIDISNRSAGTWEYQARAVNSNGQASSWSAIKSTYVNTRPNKPTNLIPGNGGTFTPSSQTFSWTDGSDPDNYPNASRQFEFDITNSNAYHFNSGLISEPTITLSLPEAGDYTWMVRAFDGNAYSDWVSSSGTANLDPNTPTINSPANSDQMLGRRITFSWMDNGDPDNFPNPTRFFETELCNQTNSWQAVANNLTSTEWTVELPSDGIYHWRLRASDGENYSPWTETISFAVYSIEKTGSNQITLSNVQPINENEKLLTEYAYQLLFDTPAQEIVVNFDAQKRPYEEFTLDLILEEADSNPSITIDIGNDNIIPWTTTIGTTELTILESPNLSNDLNAYLENTSDSGEAFVSIPISIIMNIPGKLDLANFSMTYGVGTDLTLSESDISISKSEITQGQPVAISAEIHNSGLVGTDGVLVSFYNGNPNEGGVFLGGNLINHIDGQNSVTTTLNWENTDYLGTQEINVVIDYANNINEINETNNIAFSTFHILSKPDLIIENVSLSNPEPMEGESLQISLDVNNPGETEANNVTLKLFDGNPNTDGIILDSKIIDISPESYTSTSLNWNISGLGGHQIFLQIDSDLTIDESNESNNTVWKVVFIGFDDKTSVNSGNFIGDIPYNPETGYGFIDSGAQDVTWINPPNEAIEDSLRRDPDGEVIYQFDNLLPSHSYHLDITFKEYDGAGRIQNIFVDDILLTSTPIDLRGGEKQQYSFRLDPAMYADNQVTITIKSEGIDGAIVNGISLDEIDYRYSDAGSPINDPQYTTELGFGWIDGTANTLMGTLPYQSIRIDQSDSILTYQYDQLSPEKQFQIKFTFWEQSGNGRTLSVFADGLSSGLIVFTGDYEVHTETIMIPPETYQSDNSVTITIQRDGAASGAIVNEIALEEYTIDENDVLPPNAAFTADVTTGNVPLTVNFTNQSSGTFDSVLWDFGDGQTSTGTNPSHTYSNAGIYTVSLTIDGTEGADIETKTNYIHVFTAPITDFSVNTTSGTSPLSVIFTNLSTGDYNSVLWDFGDNKSSTDLSPTHVYGAIGNFTVTLTVDGPGGSDMETKINYISVTETASSCYDLDIIVAPLNSGTTQVSPLPNCEGTKYQSGTEITVSSTANLGYQFANWSGEINSNSNPISFTIQSNSSITANFIPKNQPNIQIPSNTPAYINVPTTIPVLFTPNGQNISSIVFSIDFDQTCLAFDDTDNDQDGIPDAITMNVPSAFYGGVSYNSTDTDGEIDVTIMDQMIPLASMPDSTFLEITFTPICEPPDRTTTTTLINFSTDPLASFGNNAGMNVPGSTTNGSVIISSTTPGDANNDGQVNAGDISAIVLEIFDGDGSDAANTLNGDYAFQPTGCDANQDLYVNAGDITCTVLIIFGGHGSCGSSNDQSFTALSKSSPDLSFEVTKNVNAGDSFELPITLLANGSDISSLIFSVDYDQNLLTFDDTDSNNDQLPDSIQLNIPSSFNGEVTVNYNDQDGEIDFMIADFSTPFSTLPDGELVVIMFQTLESTKTESTIVIFSGEPQPSFGTSNGDGITGTTNSSTITINGINRVYLPLTIR